MKLKLKLVLVVAVLALFASVGTALAATLQKSPLHEFFDSSGTAIVDPQDIAKSEAKLIRRKDSVTIQVNTNSLPPGAYTNWWVIFNNPGNCNGGTAPLLCGLADLSNTVVFPATEPPRQLTGASVFWAAGGVTNKKGKAHFKARLEEGGIPDDLNDLDNSDPDDQVRISNGNGLGDAQSSEVHYILRYHGPASDDPDELESQITTINGLCDQFNQGPPVVGCYDPQAVGFLATGP